MLEAIDIPWLSEPTVLHLLPLWPLLSTSQPLWPSPSCLPLSAPIYWAHPIIRNNLPISRSLIMSTKSFLLSQIAYSQGWEIRTWMSLWGSSFYLLQLCSMPLVCCSQVKTTDLALCVCSYPIRRTRKEAWEIGFIHTCAGEHITVTNTAPLTWADSSLTLYSWVQVCSPREHLSMGTAWPLFSFLGGHSVSNSLTLFRCVRDDDAGFTSKFPCNAEPSGLGILISLNNDLGAFKHFLLLVKLPAQFSSK